MNSRQSTVSSRQSNPEPQKVTTSIARSRKREHERFYEAVITAESATVHDFDKENSSRVVFPLAMAHRGADTLRYGPMKPAGVGGSAHRTQAARRGAAAAGYTAGDHYSLVGFQTQLKWGDQVRVLRLIPGLEHAEFVRLGMVHRNTYINGPTVLTETWQVRGRGDLFIAGQMSGVEGTRNPRHQA